MAKIALLIGVSEYASGLTPVPSAIEDVDSLHQVLVDPERGDFLAANITLLKNPDRQEMENAIYRLFNDRHKDDLLLFYFSGHGIKDERNHLYLGTRITQKNDRGALVPSSAVAATYIHGCINSCRSQRQVIILDSCFSGAIAQGMTVKDDGTVRLEEYLGGKGRAILTSSTATEYSFGTESTQSGSGGLSIYTRYLVEGIETGAADLDGDGAIAVDELHEYASKKVKQASPAMTPKFYPVEEGYKIFLAKSRRDDPKLEYEQEVQIRAEQGQGEFSIFVRQILKGKQQKWGISDAEAQAIEERVLQPYREYRAKLAEYEQTLTEAIKHHYPFSDREQADLEEYQQQLKLRDEDIAEIDERVIQLVAYQKAKSRIQAKGIEIAPEVLPRFNMATINQSDSTIQLSTWEFTSVLLDAQGKIIDRPKHTAEIFNEDLGNGVSLTMVKIPAGELMMGSPESEAERSERESPQHRVRVPEFYMGQTLVTQAQWQQIMGNNPSHFTGEAKLPVEQVSWQEATEFCKQLSQRTEREYRLPSSAEY